ncbi:MAG TPA: hypothetical protein VGQ38_05450 [Gaiellaceae bacterium]|jgi:hypothetical protein|nr:hypothetical protein [Gaiellaceae bacterium]
MDDRLRAELEATLEARKELGHGHDQELAQGFVERIGKEIDRRVDERVAEVAPKKRRASALHPGNLALCIPIVAIAGGIGHTAGLIVAFTALVIVFLVAELQR